MAQINISNLTFSYDGSYDNIFEDVSFQIDTEWRLGFVGRNGRGKTTFLNLLLGKYDYAGTINADIDFLYFPFEVEDKSVLTIDIAEGINCDLELWELQKELSLLEVDPEVLYRPFETLSNGEQSKVMLAILFLKDNGYLMIDEPTNHIDMASRQTVSKYLKSKKGFILVSHDRAFLDECTDHTLSINKTNIEIQKGNFTSWNENKKRRDNFELGENEKLKKDISRLKTAAKRTSNWSDSVEKTKINKKIAGLRPDRGNIGHKSAKMMKRSKSIEQRQQQAINDKSKLLKNIEEADNLKLHPMQHHSPRLVELKDVSFSYNDRQVCKNISFIIENGDRVALCGKNGSGKSSLIKLILGENISYTGEVIVANNLSISYVSQDTSGLTGNLTDYAQNHNIDESLFKTILRKLDFSRIQFEKDMKDFSAGQKKKVLLAKSLCEKSHLYIWDEPLNYIDILSRIQIEDLILEYKPTMIFVEHDKFFTDTIATKYANL